MNVTNFRRFVSFHDKRRAINKKKNFRIFNRFFFQNLKTDATHVHRFLIDAFSKYTKSVKISNNSFSIFFVTSTKKNWIDDCVKFFITIDFDEMRRWIETIKKYNVKNKKKTIYSLCFMIQNVYLTYAMKSNLTQM